jgi:dolichol-phosphate mannosyltransferase
VSRVLSVVVPCYNEEGNVERFDATLMPVLESLAKEWDKLDVVLIDDGSTDATYAQLQAIAAKRKQGDKIEVRAVTHGTNKGLGAAIRTGFREAVGDVIVTTDSDGTYPFTEIPRILGYLAEDIDIVNASAYHPDGGVENVPRYRLVLSKGASVMYRVLVDPKIHTYTCLFRAYRRRVIEEVSFESNDFLACAEILVNARLGGFKIVEAPAILRSRVIGQSKARLVRITKSHLRFQAQVAGRRIAGLLGGRR